MSGGVLTPGSSSCSVGGVAPCFLRQAVQRVAMSPPYHHESNIMRAALLATCLIASMAVTGPAQAIVSSFPVAPAGTAFLGGLEFDCNSNIVWSGDETNNLLLAYDGSGNFLKQYAAVPPPG